MSILNIEFPEYQSIYTQDSLPMDLTENNTSIPPVTLQTPEKDYKIQLNDSNLSDLKEKLKIFYQQLNLSEDSYNVTHNKDYINQDGNKQNNNVNNNKQNKTQNNTQYAQNNNKINNLISQWLCTSNQQSKELIEELIIDELLQNNNQQVNMKDLHEQVHQLLNNSINVYNKLVKQQQLQRDQKSQELVSSILTDDQTSNDLLNQINNLIERKQNNSQQILNQTVQSLKEQYNDKNDNYSQKLQEYLEFIYKYRFTDEKYSDFIQSILNMEISQPDQIVDDIIATQKTNLINDLTKKTTQQLEQLDQKQLETQLINNVQSEIQKFVVQHLQNQNTSIDNDISNIINDIQSKSGISSPEANYNQLIARQDTSQHNQESNSYLQVQNDNKQLQNIEYNSLIAEAVLPQHQDNQNVLSAQQQTPSFNSFQIQDNLYAKRVQKQNEYNENVNNLQGRINENNINTQQNQQKQKQQQNKSNNKYIDLNQTPGNQTPSQHFSDNTDIINEINKQQTSSMTNNTLNSFKQDNSQNYFSAMFLNADKSFKQDPIEIGFQQQMQPLSKEQSDISNLYNEVGEFYNKQQIKIEKNNNVQQNKQQQDNTQQQDDIIKNYPFYSTVYQICGKCKQKHMQNNDKQSNNENIQFVNQPEQQTQMKENNLEIEQGTNDNEPQPLIQVIKSSNSPKGQFIPPRANKQLYQIENRAPITIQTIQYQKQQQKPFYVQETVFGGIQEQELQIEQQVLVGRGQIQKQNIQQNAYQEQHNQYKQQYKQQNQNIQQQIQTQLQQPQQKEQQVDKIIKVLFNGQVKQQKQQQEQQQDDTPADEIIKQVIKQSISSQDSLGDSQFSGKCASVLQKDSQSLNQESNSSQQPPQTSSTIKDQQSSDKEIKQTSQSIEQSIKQSQISQQVNTLSSTISSGQVYPQVDNKILNNSSLQISMSAGQIPSQIDKNIEFMKESGTQSLGEIN